MTIIEAFFAIYEIYYGLFKMKTIWFIIGFSVSLFYVLYYLIITLILMIQRLLHMPLPEEKLESILKSDPSLIKEHDLWTQLRNLIFPPS